MRYPLFRCAGLPYLLSLRPQSRENSVVETIAGLHPPLLQVAILCYPTDSSTLLVSLHPCFSSNRNWHRTCLLPLGVLCCFRRVWCPHDSIGERGFSPPQQQRSSLFRWQVHSKLQSRKVSARSRARRLPCIRISRGA